MKQAVKLFVLMFGATCSLIALAHVALGPWAIPGAVPVNAVMDSEDRFYATLFLGFGLALIWCALDLARRGATLKMLLLTFFCGGLARLVSLVAVGYPSDFFFALLCIELGLPVPLWLAYRSAFYASPDGQAPG